MRLKLNYTQKLLSYFLVLPFFSCENQEPISLPEADRTPPSVVIIHPLENSTVSGIVNLQVHATDNDKIDSILIIVNNENIGVIKEGNNDLFEYKWNTFEYEDDLFHTVSFVAFDRKENSYRTYPILVKIDNNDDIPPNLILENPYMGAIVSGIVPISLLASDNDSIQYVSIYVNNMLQGYVTDSPYVFTWNTKLIEDGPYSIHAIAADMSNNTAKLSPIIVSAVNGNINDNTPPTGAIMFPASGTDVSGEVTISVSASDNSGNPIEVEFGINGTSMFIDNTEPYEYAWDTATETEDQEHIITIFLEDPSGNKTILNPIAVTVDNQSDGGAPPVINILSPSSGETINGTITINVSSGNDSEINYVEFTINGVSSFVDLSFPFSFNWDSESVYDDNYYIIGAIGYNSEGVSGLASPITVYVDNYDDHSPTGQIIYPYPGQTVYDTVTIEIEASDNIGIASVEILINNNSVANITEPPYFFPWNTLNEVDDQNYIIGASITDLSNNIYIVPSIGVDVNNHESNPPNGIISNPISGQTVSGIVNFTVIASDDSGISSVEFFINGESVFIDSQSEFIFIWDTTTLNNNSQHSLSAMITDFSDNISLVQPVLVTISN